ncbi:multidrug/Oligosaccharidyl-lipid/Polysaccharide flippase [Clavulina sp. PMI_390]|nr:multidrug/Oligosaccharidyl-lipid/Polysaccharide flippase [Clavulina sp. PMI_390]
MTTSSSGQPVRAGDANIGTIGEQQPLLPSSASGSIHSTGTCASLSYGTTDAELDACESVFRDQRIGKGDQDDETSNAAWGPWKEEAKMLMKYTAPIVGTQLLESTITLAAIVSIGHLSTYQLAGVTLGFMTANVTGLSIMLGFVSALDSLLPQAWTSNPPLVGLWSQRMGVLMAILLIPISALWFSAEPILLALKQEPEVAHYASLYLRTLSISLPAYAFNCVTRRYLQSQGLMHVPTTIIIAVTPVNIFLNWFLVWGPQSIRLGFIGAPLSTVISFNLIAISTAMYIWIWDPRKAWHPVSMSMFQNLRLLVELGVAGVGQLAAEWWGWELIGLAASLLGPTSLAAQSILAATASTTFQLPFSLSVAASVRIGNHLGAGNAFRAQVATHTSLLLALAMALVLSTILTVCRNSWALLFNEDPNVAQRVAGVLPILALFQIFDGLCAVTSGVLRSRGKQGLGAILQFISYYIIGIPFGMLLTFKFDMLLPGLWIGMAVALFSGAFVTVIIVLRTNWDREVEKAAERLARDADEYLPISVAAHAG